MLRRLSFLSVFATLSAFAQVSITPGQVNMGAVAGSTAPVIQTVTVLTSGPSMTYEAGVRYFGLPDGWLTVSPKLGSIPSILTLSADPTKLPAGTYTAQVTVDAGPLHIGAWANVVFTVGSASGGNGLAVNPSSLTFAGSSAGTPQTISVDNPAGVSGRLNFTAFANAEGNWLALSQSSGSTPAVLTVTPFPGGLSAGIHSGTITIVPASGKATVVPVTLVSEGGSGTFRTEFILSQSALNLNHQIGTPVPPVQTIGVQTNDGQALVYSATASVPWIGLTATFFTSPVTTITDAAPGEFRVTIDPTGLTPGRYSGNITVTSSGLPSVSVPVTLNVSNSPGLNANPSSVVMDDISGTTVFVNVSSTGTSSLSFTATPSALSPWLNVTPASGSTAGGAQALKITANSAGLPPGTYTGTVTLSVLGSSATLDIPVRLTTTGTTAGSLLITSRDITLAAIAGGSDPSPTALVDIRSDTSHPFTAAATSSGWLSVSPTSGSAPTTIAITANKSIAPGSYDGSVTVTSLITGSQDTISVTFKVTARAMSAKPASLDFVQQKKGQVPAPQTTEITANAPSSFSVGTRPAWVSVSPMTSPGVPAVLTVSVDPTGLAPGTYNGNIQVIGPNELMIPVSLLIPEVPSPAATPASISFVHEFGGPSPAPQSIRIESPNGAVGFTVSVSTESGIDWLVVDPKSGTTPATIAASLNIARLVPGQHAGAITVTPADGSKAITIPVTARVTGSPILVKQVLNSATYAPASVAPGQLVTITGLGFGPATGIAAQPSAAGAFETRLGGVRALFDGVAAPLLFVRDDQINAIVPYALQGRVTTKLQIESGGTSFSIPIELKVVDAGPGIFTSGNSGRGQAAALNADATANSSVNPLPRGSVIVVYGTGEGQTDPPGQDGRVILTDLRRPLLPVTAKVAGREAEVLYCGSASTLVSGVFQANIRVPEDIAAGTVPIELQIGGISSQPGVTIEVR